jgi:hypothetical protein
LIRAKIDYQRAQRAVDDAACRAARGSTLREAGRLGKWLAFTSIIQSLFKKG